MLFIFNLHILYYKISEGVLCLFDNEVLFLLQHHQEIFLYALQ